VLVVEAVAAIHPGQGELVGGVGAGGGAVGDVDAGGIRQVASGPGDAVHGGAAQHRIQDAGVDRHKQSPRLLKAGSAVKGAGGVDALLLELLVPAQPEDMDGAGAVGADGAAAVATHQGELARGGTGDVDQGELGPAVPTVGGPGHVQGVGIRAGAGPADVAGKAHIGVAKVLAGGGVVGPDLLLVGEGGGAVAAGDQRGWQPGRLDPGGGGLGVVGAGDPDGLHALEPGLAALGREVAGQVGVVQPRPIGPGEVAVGVRAGTEGHRRVPVRDQAVLVVPGQGADLAALVRGERHTARVGADLAQAAPVHADSGAVAAVGGLGPGVAGVEREGDPRNSDPGGERTSGVVAGV